MLTGDQLLAATRLIDETRRDLPEGSTIHVTIDAYAPERDGTVKYNVAIEGECSDGEWGLLIEEPV